MLSIIITAKTQNLTKKTFVLYFYHFFPRAERMCSTFQQALIPSRHDYIVLSRFIVMTYDYDQY